MAKTRRRVLSILMALVLALGLLPTAVLADGSWNIGDETTTATEAQPEGTIPANSAWELIGTEPDKTADPICGKEEHKHSVECTAQEITADAYVEGPDCYTEPVYTYYKFVCEKEEHTHYFGCGYLLGICGREEHTHTFPACYEETEDPQEADRTEQTGTNTISTPALRMPIRMRAILWCTTGGWSARCTPLPLRLSRTRIRSAEWKLR